MSLKFEHFDLNSMTDFPLPALADAVTRAGQLILEIRDKGGKNGEWVGTQFKAEADLLADRALRQYLEAAIDLPVVSEEDADSQSDDRPEKYWLIDPIDGTASYAGGFSGFVCQAALMQDGKPVAAAVFAPALDKLYLAEVNKGAFLNGQHLNIRPASAEELTLVDNYPEPRGCSEYLYRELRFSRYVESGSLGLKICMVAEGLADAFAKTVVIRDWDIAPPDLILQEAGGQLSCADGRPFEYCGDFEKKGIVATGSPELHALIIDSLAARQER